MLKSVGGAIVVGSSILGGCLGSAGDTGYRWNDDTDYRWKYDVGGELDAVSQGTIFGRERSDKEAVGDGSGTESSPEANGQVVALDTDTGNLQWAYGGTGRLSSYTELTVADGIYFGYCSDDDCIGLHALDRDGEERWTNDAGTSPHSPFVADGVVYVGSDAGIASAFDAETGLERWTRRVRGPDGQTGGSGGVVEVTDAVYVETGSSFVALGRSEGNVLWRYDAGDADEQTVLDATVSNGVAYVVTSDRVAAVESGEELWHWDFEEGEVDAGTEIGAVASGRLLVLARNGAREYRLHAFDGTTGDRGWSSEPLKHPSEEYSPQIAVHDAVVYVAGKRVRALDMVTGGERWSAPLDGSPVQSVTVVGEDRAGDHSVFAHADENRLASFTPGGEQTWTGSVDGTIRNYLVDEFVFVATNEATYALDRRDDS